MAVINKVSTALRLVKQGNYLAIINALFSSVKWLGINFEICEFYSCSNLKCDLNIQFRGFTQRILSVEEILTIVPLRNKPEKISEKRYQTFLERIENFGDECRGLYLHNELVGYAWLSTKMFRFPEIEYERKLAENEVYLYDGYIVKSRQNLGLFGLFLISLVKEVTSTGKTIVDAIEPSNFKSVQMHTKIGFVPLGWYALIRFGNIYRKQISRLPASYKNSDTDV